MTQLSLINPEVVAWAQARAGLTVDDLARKMGVKPARLMQWKTGGEAMTFKQMKKLAEKTYTPLGFLFAEKPPVESLPVPDFRTFGDRDSARAKPGVDLLDTLYGMQRRQSWFRDYLIEIGAEPLPFARRDARRQNVPAVAASIREFIQTENDQGIAEPFPNKEAALRRLLESVGGKTGVLVMRNGVVGNNTRRPLDVKEFRGFALYDEYAPLIFINGKDAKAAQIFTLAHELAHIYMGEGGVSNLDFATLDKANNAEKFCNAVAAELLVPVKSFLMRWEKGKAAGRQIAAMGEQLNVSNLVVARRALESKLISRDWYWDFYKQQEKRSRKSSSVADSKKGGGSFYNAYFHRANRRFAAAVVASALEGRLSYRDAHNLLGVRKTETFNNIAERLGY